ncbi:type I restriction-modification enzyme R subunit C-terminal domain-containing protein [Slackia piriformis]|uniref:type I restriction-modification enzyme R subunit C-terminal domain-containing protein n=1 Tax=Slackia piriformis TaxID=626934 RepID=UPI0032C1D0E7
MDASEINSWVFNEATVDNVLVTLMEKGVHTQGGQELGKSVIFAQNQKHARYIVERFGMLYPSLPGDYIQAVVHSDDRSHTIIEDFELKDRPVIAVSVDMMDTGVDVPEIVNLVFFKKVRSKIKFWQMIGRGTRLREGLEVVDPIDGPHEDKERFFIFDWCRNFEFFRENPHVKEGKLAVTVAEQVFVRQAELAAALQGNAFSGEEYQAWRAQLVETMRSQVVALNDELFTVRSHRREVEKYRRVESYVLLSSVTLAELKSPISMLVVNDESDFDALRFDNLMYGYMVALCQARKVEPYRKRVAMMAQCLSSLVTVPQVKEQLPFIERVADGRMLDGADLLALEDVRVKLRSLIKFIVKGPRHRDVVTHLDDPVTQITYGIVANIGEDFEDYKLKVERYLKDYGNNLVIHKLRTNKPMTEYEFGQLERIFTHELGNAEDYARAYGDTPFGLLVRKIAHLDRDAAMEAFAGFLNDQSLNEQQISFIKRVVDYVVENGYMEPRVLNQPPFDRPRSFMQIFSTQQQMDLVGVIKSIKENAVTPAA